MAVTGLRGAVLALALVLGCNGASKPTPPKETAPVAAAATPTQPPAPTEHVLVADTKVFTSSLASFTAPAGWKLEQEQPDVISLVDPEGSIRLWIVEIQGGDADSAFAAGWAKVQPGFARTVERRDELPAVGWHQQVQIGYALGPDARFVMAMAYRFNDVWSLLLVESGSSTDQRQQQLFALVGSFVALNMGTESLAGKPARPLDATRLAAFTEFIEKARVASNIPGAAVAVVHGDEILLEHGLGVRELGKPAKITPATRFLIASATKPLTTLMMARLVDAQKLAWDTSMTKLAPSFAVGDKATTKAMTLQHMVCACSGMPRQAVDRFFFPFAGDTPESRIASLKTIKPTARLGERFQYSNLMVAAGGYLAARATGKGSYDQAYKAAMQAEVFGPLGMKDSSLTAEEALAGEHAAPHIRDYAMTYQSVPVGVEAVFDSIRPAGAAWSTVRDLARYLSLELGSGMLDGKRIVSKQNLLYRRVPRVKLGATKAYGLGLFIEELRGVPLVHHGGNALGFTSDLFLLPEHGVGVVLLTNAGTADSFRLAVRLRFLELLFDGTPVAEAALTQALERDRFLRAEIIKRSIRPTPDAAWIAKLIGHYHNAELGDLEVRRQGDTYLVDVGEWQSTAAQLVEPDEPQKLILTGVPRPGLVFTPQQEKRGAASLLLVSPEGDFLFTRVGE